MDIGKKISILPNKPGVYLMKDRLSRIIYVGKASKLKARVAAYFRSGKKFSFQKQTLIDSITDLDYIVTGTEVDALLLEANLIKQHQPKYNVSLKDDKSYPHLKLTSNEDFPRLFITRKKKEDGATYYGPYTDVKLLREALALMRKIFPLRKCRSFPKKPCLDYHLGQCLAPCIGRVNVAFYNQIVKELILFLEGKSQRLIDELASRMNDASGKRDFEEAARIRDRIEALLRIVRKSPTSASGSYLEELKVVLGLSILPRRIFAYDISDIQGALACGVKVSFWMGKLDKSGYRRFRIKGADKIDDYKMMKETISRSFKELLKRKEPLPDLLIIDGGKGHVRAVQEEMDSLGLGNIPVVGIAKKFEQIFFPLKNDPLILPPDSRSLKLIQRIRDEAHRFALQYHLTLRRKGVSKSALDQIKGVGPLRKRELINYFGSVDKIKRARIQGLLRVDKIDRKTAESIVEYFRKHR